MDKARVLDAFKKRLEIYRTKHERAKPLGDEIYNRWEATRYVIEALELLAVEAGIAGDVGVELEDGLRSGLEAPQKQIDIKVGDRIAIESEGKYVVYGKFTEPSKK